MPPADKGEVPRQWDRRKDSSCRLTPLSRAAPRRFITESPEASLKRVGTDHLDPLMCPHGADTPEDLACPEILETFQQLKRQGKVRWLMRPSRCRASRRSSGALALSRWSPMVTGRLVDRLAPDRAPCREGLPIGRRPPGLPAHGHEDRLDQRRAQPTMGGRPAAAHRRLRRR